jgi:hypothetical protein
MTEDTWKVRKELLETRLLFWQVQTELIKKLQAETSAELAKMGEKWVAEPAPLREVVNE